MAKNKTATESGSSKTQAVLDQLAKTPDAPPDEVAAAASTASGLDISRGLVYSVKSRTGGTKKKARRKKVAVKRSAAKKISPKKTSPKETSPKETSPVQDVVHAGELMMQAVDLVMKAGYKEAKSMIDLAGKMVDRIKEK